MRRSRFVAALIAVLMATSALLVPGTAQADVTDLVVSVNFDNQSVDRVATITVRAKSQSGITDVEAVLKHRPATEPPLDEWVEFGTLPFTLIDGTVNDGTWRAEYQTDIENYPGLVEADVTLTSADGATESTPSGIFNCYPASITDLTTTPAAVDFDDREVMVEGRVLVHKTHDADPVPAANVTVATGRSWAAPTTQTAADGTFKFTRMYEGPYSLEAQVSMVRTKWLCNASEYAPEPEVDKQATEVLAQLVAPDRVTVGNKVKVAGWVKRQADGGSVSAVDQPVLAYVDGQAVQMPEPVRTDEDGQYELEFTAEASGTVSVKTEGGTFLEPGEAVAGELTVRPRTEIAFTVPEEPTAYGDLIGMSGRVVDGGSPVTDGEVELEFSKDGESGWTYDSTAFLEADGSFEINGDGEESGYWRVRHVGDQRDIRGTSEVKHVEVRYRTDLKDFSAKPGAGGVVTVEGALARFTGEWEPATLPVYVYFMPAGSTTWEFQGTTTAGADGTFAAQFVTHRDGYWTAAFWGDDDHLASDAPIAQVNVAAEYGTRFSGFDVSPESVNSGGSITVSGSLNRFVNESDPEAAADLPVHVYFLPAGSSTWTEVAVLRTGADGSFEKSLTANQDGYWTAWFWGDGDHARSNSATKHVDVQ